MIDTQLITAINSLEASIMSDPLWTEGAAYGKPRRGHPEGAVANHIVEVLSNVERYRPLVGQTAYEQLRLVALIHDTFKYAVDKSRPKVGENHHGMIARRFAERYIKDTLVLDLIELHDQAYHAYCDLFQHQNPDVSQSKMANLAARFPDHLRIYFVFFLCDTQTGDKTQHPIEWLVEQLPEAATEGLPLSRVG